MRQVVTEDRCEIGEHARERLHVEPFGVAQQRRMLHQTRAHKAMLELSLGERVCFQSDGRPLLFGIVTRYNKKTVAVITDSGEHWSVSPAALRKASDVADPAGSTNVVQLRKK